MSLVREILGKMRNKLKHIDLFSGIGGFSLAFEATQKIETVAFCEIEEYPQKVLKKNFPDVPIYNDIRELVNNGSTRPIWGQGKWQEIECDILTGGYPCQPFSQAGKRKGEKDDRHLWPFMLEIIKQKRPKFIVAENVAGHITLGLDNVLFDLEGEGYSARAVVLPASSVNAHHRRDRVWVIGEDMADTSTYRSSGKSKRDSRSLGKESKRKKGTRNQSSVRSETRSAKISKQDVADSDSSLVEGRSLSSGVHEKHSNINSGSTYEDVADTSTLGQSRQGELIDSSDQKTHEEGETTEPFDGGFGEIRSFESYLGGRSDGLSAWVDGSWEQGIDRVTTNPKNRANRLKALGNAIVPQVAYWIALAILGEEDE